MDTRALMVLAVILLGGCSQRAKQEAPSVSQEAPSVSQEAPSASVEAQLLGTWHPDPADKRSLDEYGAVSMRFDVDGKLEYRIRAGDKDQIMLLTYKVAGHWLITDQPSHPREQRSEFSFTPDGKLALMTDASSAPSLWVRQSPPR